LRLRSRSARRQHLHALGILLFLVQHRGRFSKGGFRGIDIDFEGPSIKFVKNVACFDVAALLEIAVDDDAGHARADLRDPGRRDAAGQLADDSQRRRLQFDNADLRDSRSALAAGSGGAFAAAGEQPRKWQSHKAVAEHKTCGHLCCSPFVVAALGQRRPPAPDATRPDTVPSQWLRRFRAMLRSPS
jgi:hypothetical protein